MTATTSVAPAAHTEPLPATAAAPEPLAGGYRVPRIDLLPPEITQERRLRTVQRGLAIGLGVLVLLVGIACTESVISRDAATAALAHEQRATAVLTARQQHYAAVPATLSQLDATRTALATGMAHDVLWASYLDRLSRTTPADVSFKSFAAALTSASDASGTSGQAADPLTPAGVGTLTIEATGTQQTDTAAWLDVLNGTPGLTGAAFSASSLDPTKVPALSISSSAVITAAALSHRYDAGKD